MLLLCTLNVYVLRVQNIEQKDFLLEVCDRLTSSADLIASGSEERSIIGSGAVAFSIMDCVLKLGSRTVHAHPLAHNQ